MIRSVARLARFGPVPLVALLSWGCFRLPPKSQFPTATHALEQMKAAFSCANGIKTSAKVERYSKQGLVRTKVDLFAFYPARLRIEIDSPFGGTPVSLASDGKTFRLSDTQKNEFLYGPAKPCNLARLTRVPVPGHVLVTLLRGEPPLLKHERAAPSIVWRDGVYRVNLASAHGAEQVIELEVHEADFDKPWQKQRLRLKKLTTRQHDVVLYVASLDKHRLASTAPPRVDPAGLYKPVPPSGGPCDVEIPRKVRLQVPSSGDDVTFEYTEVKLNQPLLERTFTLNVPPGAKKIYVDCK